MNEVRPTQYVNQVVARTASSKGLVDTREPGGGKQLPQVEDTAETSAKSVEANKVDLKSAIADINQYVQKVNRDLHFSLDDDSGRTVIRVVDRESGDLIRQIPEDIFLRLARNLKDNEPIHLVNAHG